ncbi:MAG: uracil-DNA glycosylase [Deltaproteobacteria bacterium]|nr:uracil-DNA glycosylase [Deltaproteobacteria bacterium]
MIATKEMLRCCRRCGLYRTRRNVVIGRGDPNAGVVFVGEAPGEKEDEQGLPFVGRAGGLLDFVMREISFEIPYYITNILKCRPPNNRNPDSGEIERCLPWLISQLEIISPSCVVTLGGIAASVLLPSLKARRISAIKGKFYNTGTTVIYPMWHPAYVLRNKSRLKEFIMDFHLLKVNLK